MQLAPTYITAAATLIVGIAALWGKQIELNSVIGILQALVVILGPAFIMFRQWQTGKSTVFGSRPA